MKLAIIGASSGQLPLCKKAKELGYETLCFAWDKGAVCKDVVDHFYPISIFEEEEILNICRQEQVVGVVTNASDVTAEIASFLTTSLNLHGIDYSVFQKIKDKFFVRNRTRGIFNLNKVTSFIYEGQSNIPFPCVVKPVTGNGKKGVSFARNMTEFGNAVEYALREKERILVEEYIEGIEISVESISYEGKHYVLQITDKISSGPPHFLELGHHEPSLLPEMVKDKIRNIVPKILAAIGIENSATHIELKVDKNGNVYLIEVNPRGGGGNISNCLVMLSTGYDYLKGMIEVATGQFSIPEIILSQKFCGSYFVVPQNFSKMKQYFTSHFDWEYEKNVRDIDASTLSVATTNYDRIGYVTYLSDERLNLM